MIDKVEIDANSIHASLTMLFNEIAKQLAFYLEKVLPSAF